MEEKNKTNPYNTQVWKDVGAALRLQLRAVKGNCGVLLIEKDGAVCAIVVGDEEAGEGKRLSLTLRQFEERLGEMARHAENEDVDLGGKDDKFFIRDSETGHYEEPG